VENKEAHSFETLDSAWQNETNVGACGGTFQNDIIQNDAIDPN
jgi:hypothetical protein